MSDLDKLMKKLKKDDPVEEKAEEKPVETPELDDDEDEEDQVEEETPQETEEVTPVEDPKPNPVEHEVALLQNDGVFRRELIITLKELVDVHKVNTQTLLDVKDFLIGDKNAKKTKK